MNEPMFKFMKVGLIHCVAFPNTLGGEGPIEETVKKIAVNDFFQATEITWIKDEKIRRRVQSILGADHITGAVAGHIRLLSRGLNI